MDALILFAHGSLLCGAGEALDSHAHALRASGQWPLVHVGYMNYSSPTFSEAVAACHNAGAKNILILPFFLVPGYFVRNSLPKHVAEAQTDYPDLNFVIAEAIGFDERLADALIQSARLPLGPDEWRDDLTAAARHCRARSDCPLYGTPNCPRVPAPETPVRPFVE